MRLSRAAMSAALVGLSVVSMLALPTSGWTADSPEVETAVPAPVEGSPFFWALSVDNAEGSS